MKHSDTQYLQRERGPEPGSSAQRNHRAAEGCTQAAVQNADHANACRLVNVKIGSCSNQSTWGLVMIPCSCMQVRDDVMGGMDEDAEDGGMED